MCYYYTSAPVGKEALYIEWRCLSVRLSVCLWRASTLLENGRPKKPKMGRMVAHHACIP